MPKCYCTIYSYWDFHSLMYLLLLNCLIENIVQLNEKRKPIGIWLKEAGEKIVV